MSGLSSNLPHYVFGHSLTADGFDRWALNGIDPQNSDEQENLLPVLMAFIRAKSAEWYVLELDDVQLDSTVPTNLGFTGSFVNSVGGISMQLRCAGYIALRGTGVMWIREGDTPL